MRTHTRMSIMRDSAKIAIFDSSDLEWAGPHYMRSLTHHAFDVIVSRSTRLRGTVIVRRS